MTDKHNHNQVISSGNSHYVPATVDTVQWGYFSMLYFVIPHGSSIHPNLNNNPPLYKLFFGSSFK